MSTSAGASGVTSGLILDLDLGNRKSYVKAANSSTLLNSESWTIGTGAVGIFATNGTVAEQQRLVTDDPMGNQNIVWQSNPVDGNADGGWESAYFNIDRTKLYRYSVWIRRTSAAANGNFYVGLHTNGTGDTINVLDGSISNTNPYWDYGGIGALTQNQWYLFVGHIFPTGSVGTTNHPNTGYYLAGSTSRIGSNLGGNISDARFPSDATQAMQRVYHYYSGDPNSHLQFAYPRVEVVDGTELSMSELSSNSYTMIRDTSGYNNHHYLNTTAGTVIPFASNALTLDGSTQFIGRVGALAGATTTCSGVFQKPRSRSVQLLGACWTPVKL